MRKTLLLSIAAGACAMSASSAIITPTIFDECQIQSLSANGRFAVSELYGTVTVLDLETGDSRVFEADEMGVNYYGVGYGQCITADGSVIVGNTRENTDAAYLDATGWHALSVGSEDLVNISHGITPDGSRICGCVGTHEMSINEDVLMSVPAYWDRNPDGTYGEYHVLPHPTVDLFGATPQYVTAVCISEDGKTIVGQMTDCLGSMVIPVLYKQDASGEWSYSLPTEHLFNPEGLEQVLNPGEYDGPAYPSQEAFMTEAEIAAYNDALNEYYQTWEGDFPVYETFMTEEEIAAYNEAKTAYETAYNEWDEKYNAYADYYYGVLAVSPNFVFNNIAMTRDGRYIASSAQVEVESDDPLSWMPFETKYFPWMIDLTDGNITKYEERSLLVSDIADGGVVLASTPVAAMYGTFTLHEGFVLENGTTTNITDFLHGISPEYTSWFKTNMSHEIADYVENEETGEWEEVYNEYVFTGAPVVTPDMSVIALWNNADWDYGMSGQSVLIKRNDLGAVDTVAVAEGGLSVDGAGNLCVSDDVVSVEVFDLAGACVLKVASPSATVALPLESGVYVARAVHASGASETLKIAK